MGWILEIEEVFLIDFQNRMTLNLINRADIF